MEDTISFDADDDGDIGGMRTPESKFQLTYDFSFLLPTATPPTKVVRKLNNHLKTFELSAKPGDGGRQRLKPRSTPEKTCTTERLSLSSIRPSDLESNDPISGSDKRGQGQQFPTLSQNISGISARTDSSEQHSTPPPPPQPSLPPSPPSPLSTTSDTPRNSAGRLGNRFLPTMKDYADLLVDCKDNEAALQRRRLWNEGYLCSGRTTEPQPPQTAQSPQASEGQPSGDASASPEQHTLGTAAASGTSGQASLRSAESSETSTQTASASPRASGQHSSRTTESPRPSGQQAFDIAGFPGTFGYQLSGSSKSRVTSPRQRAQSAESRAAFRKRQEMSAESFGLSRPPTFEATGTFLNLPFGTTRDEMALTDDEDSSSEDDNTPSRPVGGDGGTGPDQSSRVDGTGTVADQLARWAQLDGYDRVFAFSYLRESQAGKPLERGCSAVTTQQLNVLARRFAYSLRHEYGVTERTVVCSLVPPSPERLVVDMGIMLCGGIVLSLESSPRAGESRKEYILRVITALKRTGASQLFCTAGFPVSEILAKYILPTAQHVFPRVGTGMMVHIHFLAIRDRTDTYLGFLNILQVEGPLMEFADPNVTSTHPAAIFMDTDDTGQDILVFYQHQAILQLGAQMTQVLQLDRRRDVLFNPCPPSQPWGFHAAFLYSGVHTVTFDRSPLCRGGDGVSSMSPWTLEAMEVNVAFFTSPALDIFSDHHMEHDRPYVNRFPQDLPSAETLIKAKCWNSKVGRVGVAGTPLQQQTAASWLRRRWKADVIIAMHVSVCLGVLTSRRSRDSVEDDLALSSGDVGQPLGHLQMAVEDPDNPGTPLPQPKSDDDEVTVGNILIKSLYDMPRPIKRFNGNLTCLETHRWTPAGLVGFLDGAGCLHVVGTLKHSVVIFKDRRWRIVHLMKSGMKKFHLVAMVTLDPKAQPPPDINELKTAAQNTAIVAQDDDKSKFLVLDDVIVVDVIARDALGVPDLAVLMRQAWTALKEGRKTVLPEEGEPR